MARLLTFSLVFVRFTSFSGSPTHAFFLPAGVVDGDLRGLLYGVVVEIAARVVSNKAFLVLVVDLDLYDLLVLLYVSQGFRISAHLLHELWIALKPIETLQDLYSVQHYPLSLDGLLPAESIHNHQVYLFFVQALAL